MKKYYIYVLFVWVFIFKVHLAFAGPSADGSTLLAQSISDDKKARMRATQELVWYFKESTKVIDEALTYLNSSNDARLSNAGRINLLYYLSNTSTSGWTTETLQKTRGVLQTLKRDHGSKPQTNGLITNLADLVGNFAPAQRSRVNSGIETNKIVEIDPTLPVYHESHALIIGNSKYDSWDDLGSVQQEVEDIELALRRRGFEVERKSNLSGDEIREAFKKFIESYGLAKENRLLFYYSGHGDTQLSNDERRGYIIGRDTPQYSKNSEEFKRRAVSMNDIEGYAKRIEAKHALFIFDSCFSGTIFKVRGRIKFPDPILSYTSRPVRQFITSGKENETVPAQSDFAIYFLRALNDDTADLTHDGFITATELGIYLYEEIVPLKKQTPQWGKILDSRLNEGDFVFLPAK